MTDLRRIRSQLKPAWHQLLARILAPVVFILVIIGTALLLTACGRASPIGAIDDTASLSVLSFETIDQETSGIVYRTVEDFPAFIAQTEVPVLLVFHAPMDPVNTRVIPRIEQLADDHQGRLAIVWIDATVESKLASDFQVNQLPQFTMLVEAAIKRSLIGYGDNGQEQLDQLVKTYIEP
ncbi:MAG: hypothetical protein EOM08_07760 [Clostridia bacterium]|nr:hypothetical protein [Clostridia bacterium]